MPRQIGLKEAEEEAVEAEEEEAAVEAEAEDHITTISSNNL